MVIKSTIHNGAMHCAVVHKNFTAQDTKTERLGDSFDSFINSSAKDLRHLGADVCRAVHHVDATLAHHALLRFGRLVFARHDGPCVAHGAALRRRNACDEADDRFGAVLFNPTRRLHFEITADLADHHDALGFFICHQELNGVQRGRTDDGVTADADGRGLAEAGLRALVDRFVSQGAGLRHDAHNTGLEDEAWHDAHFGLACRDDAWAVGADQRAIPLVDVRFHFHHIRDGNAFSDGDDDLDASVRRFHQGVCRKCGWHKYNADVRTGFRHSVGNGIEYRAIQVGLTAFSRSHTTNHIGAIFYHLAGMEGAFASGEALHNDFGIAVYKNAHVLWLLFCSDCIAYVCECAANLGQIRAMKSPLHNAVDGATICAISTAPGAGGIAVVRISGDDALALGSQVFSKNLSVVADREAVFGRFRDASGTLLDEGLALIFRGPKSYTGEDTVEFNIHGSTYIQSEVMRALIEAGCRQAGPGEFTQRAFLNGRIDLTQAEAVADLIAAQHAGAHRLALEQLRGGFAKEINALREALIGFAGLLELELDFAEEDVEFADRERFDALLADLLSRVSLLAESFATGNAMKEGIPVAILGAPNRGKSTLLNALLGDDRAIVSDIPGTTRDTVEDTCNIDGLKFRFIDTAGLRNTEDTVEAEGIRRALEKAAVASTVLLILDASTDSNEDVQSKIDDLHLAKDIHIIVVWNKCDLAPAPPVDARLNTIALSASSGEGLDDLKQELVNHYRIADQGHQLVVTNLRHFEALTSAKSALQAVRDGLTKEIPSDLIAVDVRQALHHLSEITGAVHADDILGHIFSHFCIGK